MTYKVFFPLVVFWFFSVGTVAQTLTSGTNGGKERIATYIKRYADLFALNEKDALEFDALYKEYSKQMRIIHNKMRQNYSSPADSLTDEQIEQRILDNFTNSRAILDVREQYYHRFRTILSPTQINVIFEDEKSRREQMRKHVSK